jgi:hypothetical protein
MSIQDRIHFNLYEHVPTCQLFAVRTERGQITGCLGPYRLDVARVTDITALDYDADTRWVVWAGQEAAEGNFDLTG